MGHSFGTGEAAVAEAEVGSAVVVADFFGFDEDAVAAVVGAVPGSVGAIDGIAGEAAGAGEIIGAGIAAEGGFFAEVIGSDDPDFGVLDGVVIETAAIREADAKAVFSGRFGDGGDVQFDLWRGAVDEEAMAADGLASGVDEELIRAAFKFAETIEVGDESDGRAADVGASFGIEEEALGEFIDGDRVNGNRENSRVLADDGEVDVELVAALADGSPIEDLLIWSEGKGDLGEPLALFFPGANAGEVRERFADRWDDEVGVVFLVIIDEEFEPLRTG